MPLLSVLMPVRDGAATVGLAVRSTLRAMPRDAELLVHDDASTDTTAQALARVDDPRLRVVRTDVARGVSGGLQHLLDLADSRVVARMDADDVCLPGRFARQVPAVLDGAADVLFGGVVTFRDGPRHVRPTAPVGLTAAALPLHLVLGNPVAHSTVLARADVIRAVGGYRQVLTEDYDLWLRLAVHGARMRRDGRPVTAYRIHPAQVSASGAWASRPPLETALVPVYRDLCLAVLGREPSWWPNPRRNPQSPEQLADLAAALGDAARRLGPLQRRLLLRKVAAARRHAAPSAGAAGVAAVARRGAPSPPGSPN